MKKLCVFALCVVSQVALLRAEPEATKDKITRDEAQHIALQQVPNGSVKSANLKQENGRKIWAVLIGKPGSNSRTKIQVDAYSGRIVPAQEPAAPAEGPSKDKK